MEQAQQEKVYMERLPLVAMQIRSALGNIYYGMQKLAPADERDEDPILDANAAMLYHGYFRLLRLAKNLESASMLNRKELLPTENTDLKVWLDEIIREAEVPFELKGVQLEMVCEERYAITAVNEPWLSQALWQLLSNALKACSAGGKVTVTLAVQKPHVLIKVKDTGCGIPADRQEMLFRWHMRPMTLDYVAGGVDSSAAAALLVQQGYDCDGAMLKLAPNEDSRCCSADDAEDARQAATRLGMRFYVFNETDRFRRCVMDRFTAEYAAGRTPNPCIDCNRELKFGALLDRALTLGYDYIATGHYARVAYDAESGRYRLLRGAERRKDQSYVLYQLTQHQLAHLLLPVGDYDKPAIRDKAREAGLDNADKGDSQDICFVPDGDYVTFLQRQGLTLTPGDFLDEAGRVLGRHRGLPCYTIGQGKGLGVAVGRHVYVLEKDRDRNAIVLGDDAALYASSLLASHVNWISGQIPAAPVRCAAKTRYSQVETPCTAYPLPDGGLRVVFDQPQRAITPGQAVVLYDGDVVLGGGTIEKSE